MPGPLAPPAGNKNITGMVIDTAFLVIGAGPAGCACAWKLAREGRDVVLADRSVFPRPKLCGGALSGNSAGILLHSGMMLSSEIDDLVLAVHDTFSCFDSLKPLGLLRGASPPMRLVDRRSFDGFLFNRAVEAGVRPLVGSRLVAFEDGNQAVFSNGCRVRFERAVGADGALSTVRRLIFGSGLRGRPGFCLETFVPLAPAVMEAFAGTGLQAHFGLLPYGYGWVFPRRDDVCVGVGSFGNRYRPWDTLRAMDRLLDHLELGRRRFMGAFVPAGRGSVFPGSGRVLLAGDAAGLCDRVSGEGISHGLESGLLAADALLAGAETWNTGSRCVRRVNSSGVFRHLLYGWPFRALAMNRLAAGDHFHRIYWGITSGELEYRTLLQRSRARRAPAT